MAGLAKSTSIAPLDETGSILGPSGTPGLERLLSIWSHVLEPQDLFTDCVRVLLNGSVRSTRKTVREGRSSDSMQTSHSRVYVAMSAGPIPQPSNYWLSDNETPAVFLDLAESASTQGGFETRIVGDQTVVVRLLGREVGRVARTWTVPVVTASDTRSGHVQLQHVRSKDLNRAVDVSLTFQRIGVPRVIDLRSTSLEPYVVGREEHLRKWYPLTGTRKDR